MHSSPEEVLEPVQGHVGIFSSICVFSPFRYDWNKFRSLESSTCRVLIWEAVAYEAVKKTRNLLSTFPAAAECQGGSRAWGDSTEQDYQGQKMCEE
jgi:hypothetical protein